MAQSIVLIVRFLPSEELLLANYPRITFDILLNSAFLSQILQKGNKKFTRTITSLVFPPDYQIPVIFGKRIKYA